MNVQIVTNIRPTLLVKCTMKSVTKDMIESITRRAKEQSYGQSYTYIYVLYIYGSINQQFHPTPGKRYLT